MRNFKYIANMLVLPKEEENTSVIWDSELWRFLSNFHSSLTDGGELKKRLERIALKHGASVEQVLKDHNQKIKNNFWLKN